MKISLLDTTETYDAKGHRAIGLADSEEELIQNLDEQKMSPQKLLASRFLTFLGNHRLNLEKLKQLSQEEQDKLREEFRLNN